MTLINILRPLHRQWLRRLRKRLAKYLRAPLQGAETMGARFGFSLRETGCA